MSTTTLDRLRRLHKLRPQQTQRDIARDGALERAAPNGASGAERAELVYTPLNALGNEIDEATALATLVPGRELENHAGVCYVRSQRLPLSTPHGPRPLGELFHHCPSLFAKLHPQHNLSSARGFRRAAFIDTETTGLGGGAGVYCFMVGVGLFEGAEADEEPRGVDGAAAPTHFTVHQLFMRNPAEEPALLVALLDLLAGRDLLVTFNGRTFDLPLLRTRLRQNRRALDGLELPLLAEGAPHFDLLHPARRLWRRRLQSCRLINLERQILRRERSGDDVPSHLIPLLYTQFVRDADARPLRGIFYHNHEDIVSMVALAERLCAAFAPLGETNLETNEADDCVEVQGLDWVGLGICYEEQEAWAQAERAYRRGLAATVAASDRADLYARLGRLLKRQARWAEATELWQLWLTSVPGIDPTPYVELAKYCEWQTRDLEQAAMWTGWALHSLHSAPPYQRAIGPIRELEHRLARIERKRQR